MMKHTTSFAKAATNAINYNMMFKTQTLGLLILLLLLSTKAYAQCGSPNTCITMDMIGTGQNALVNVATPNTNIKEITGQDSPTSTAINCDLSPKIKTGVTVYRYFAPTKVGEYRKYDEHFCLSQGCNFQGGLTGTPVCTKTAP